MAPWPLRPRRRGCSERMVFSLRTLQRLRHHCSCEGDDHRKGSMRHLAQRLRQQERRQIVPALPTRVSLWSQTTSSSASVTARKDDAPAADQAAITNVAVVPPSFGGSGLI